MLVIKIEIWPLGQESLKRELGTAYIANDISGDRTTGNYNYRLMKSPEYAKRPGVWKRGRVENFPRQRLGPWDLLFRALRDSVEYRNKSGGTQ
jgi:hypothetical protein